MPLMPFLINPRGNPAHPGSYGADLPLSFSESIGGHRRSGGNEYRPGRVTKAEEARMKAIREAGRYVPIAERGGGVVVRSAPTRRVRRPHAPVTRVATPARRRTAARPTRPHTHWHQVKSHKRRTNPSPAQLAARKRFAAAARAGTLRKGTKLSTRNARTSGAGSSSRGKEAGPMARRKRRRRTTAAAGHRRRRNPVRKGRKRVHRRKHALFTTAARHRVGLNPRRRRRHRVNMHHRKRRTHRRNPLGLPSGRGIMNQLMAGAKDGFVVVLGRGVTGYVANKIPFGQTSAVSKAAINLGVGLGLSYAVRKVSKSERLASFFLAGAFSKVLEPLVGAIPGVGPILAPGGVSAWPQLAPGMAAWPQLPAAPIQRANLHGWEEWDSNYSDGIQS